MSGYILLAIFTGIIIGTSRAINGRLSMDIGPFKASFCNHIVGFLFLTSVLAVMGSLRFDAASNIPFYTYFGGFFGALFVAINSYVFPRIGAIKTVLLVISGQMIFSVLIDSKNGTITTLLAQLMGVAIILLGIYLANKRKK